MKISRENYELFFIYYIDGTLSDDAVDDLLIFLTINPDLAEELSELQSVKLEPDNNQIFGAKSSLHKNEFDRQEYFEQKCVESIEGLLVDDDKLEFSSYLKLHPSKKRELKLFQLTVFKPDLKVIYIGKERLKKRTRLFYYLNSAAAIILVLLSIWFVEQKNGNRVNYDTAVVAPDLNSAVSDSKITTVEAVASLNNNSTANVPLVAEKKITKQVVKSIKKVENEVVDLAPKLAEVNDTFVDTQFEETTIIEHLEPLASLTAILKIHETIPTYIAGVDTAIIEPLNIEDNRFADKVKEAMSEKIASFDGPAELQRIGKGILDRVGKFSFRTIGYSTDSEGEISAIAFSTAVFNITFPVKNPSE